MSKRRKAWLLTVEDVYTIKGRGRIAVGAVAGVDGDRLPKPGDVAFTSEGRVVKVVGVELLRGFVIDRQHVGVVMNPTEAALAVKPGMTLSRIPG